MTDDDPVIVPFVVVASVGGMYQDDSFFAGYEIGRLEADLDHARATGHFPAPRWLKEPLTHQADLAAMARNFVMRTRNPGPEDDQESVYISFG